jgi:rod shape determining protein RodA
MKTTEWNEFFRRYDYSFFSTIGAIFFIGIVNLYSATHNDANALVQGLYKSQLLWFTISVLVGFLVSLFNTKTIMRFSYIIYLSVLLLLVLVLVMGKIGMGAQRWLDLGPLHIQPSEFMKLSLVLVLSHWYSRHDPDLPLDFKKLILPSVLAFIPAVMVVVQPDLGTGILLLLIFGFMSFYRKLKWSTITKLILLGLVASGIMYEYVLKDYQRKRIEMFVNPYKDAKGSGYNAIQSEIAIGSGKIKGKGFMKSSQASLNFLPENHTDFVFSIYNEEHGILGSIVLISLYLFLLLRLLWLSRNVNSFYDSLLVVGITSIFFWHIFINMGMVTGLLPIVGIPLPLMSYGGSSLLTFGICIGVATSISNSRTMFSV